MKKFWDWVERILKCLDKIPLEKEEDLEKDILKKVDIIKILLGKSNQNFSNWNHIPFNILILNFYRQFLKNCKRLDYRLRYK